MEFLIITGLSGAGKSRAADVLEDLDYYCVDNMPVALLGRFAEFCIAAGGRYEKVALVTDVRENKDFSELLKTLDELEATGLDCRILYMDADESTIIRRYKESRRPHPLAENGLSIEESVRRECELLAPVKDRADHIVNTSGLTLGMLQNRLFALFAEDGQKRELNIPVIAFGYKYGIPLDADLVFDVRFLPNPYYIDELKPLSGLDRAVYDYVMDQPDNAEYLRILTDFFVFQLPRFREEGKPSLTVAVGCTGGRHRSITVARALTDILTEKGENARLICRDLGRAGEYA